MNRQEAYKIAAGELALFESLPYRELAAIAGHRFAKTQPGDSGVTYQIDTELFWGDENRSHIRITVTVDNLGWFTFSPITESATIKAPQ